GSTRTIDGRSREDEDLLLGHNRSGRASLRPAPFLENCCSVVVRAGPSVPVSIRGKWPRRDQLSIVPDGTCAAGRTCTGTSTVCFPSIAIAIRNEPAASIGRSICAIRGRSISIAPGGGAPTLRSPWLFQSSLPLGLIQRKFTVCEPTSWLVPLMCI